MFGEQQKRNDSVLSMSENGDQQFENLVSDCDTIIPSSDITSINMDGPNEEITPSVVPSTESKAIIYSSRGLMGLSPAYNSSRYFTIIDVAKKIFGEEALKKWMEIYLGSGCVAANAALSSYGFYNIISLEKANKLRRDVIGLFIAFGPAVSDDFSAFLGDNPLQNSEELYLVVFKYFNVVTFVIAAWALNYASLLRLDGRWSTDKETLHLIDQLKSLSYDLMGREAADLEEKKALIEAAIKIVMVLDAEENLYSSGDSIEAFVSGFDITQKKQFMNELCKSIPLWNDNASWGFMTTYHYKPVPMIQFILRYPYRFIAMTESVLSAVTLFLGPYALTLKLWGSFFPDSSKEYIPWSIGTVWGLLPPIVKSIVYFLLWTNFLFTLFHVGDTFRNVLYRLNQRPLLVSMVMSVFTAILLWVPASGLGFYDTVEAFIQFTMSVIQFIQETITNIDADSNGDIAASYLQIIRQIWDFGGVVNGCVINNSALLTLLAAIWAHIQEKFLPAGNELSTFFNGQAGIIAMGTIPKETIATRVGDRLCGTRAHTEEEIPLMQQRPSPQNSSRTWCGFFSDTVSATVNAISSTVSSIPSGLGAMVDNVVFCPNLSC